MREPRTRAGAAVALTLARQRARGYLVLALALLLGACGGAPAANTAVPASASAKPAAPASAPASASAKPAASAAAPTKLTLALSTTAASQLPFWLASDAGYFQKNGLDVTRRTVTGGANTTATILSGEVQVVSGGGAEALSAITNGADLVILGTTGPKFEYIFEVSSKIKSGADLKGQHVGVPAIGGNADIAMHAALQKLGLVPGQDVIITATGAQNTSLAALNSHAIEGTMLSPPGNLIAEQQGAHPLMNMADQDVFTSGGSIYTQRSYFTANHAVMQAFVDSVVEATARIKADKSTAIDVMKKELKSDDEAGLNAAYDFYSKEFPALPYPKPEYFQEAMNTLSKNNEKMRGFDLSKVLDPSLVQSAADRGLDKKP